MAKGTTDEVERLLREMRESGESTFPAGHGAARLLARAKAALGCEAPSLASLAVTVADGRLGVERADGRVGEVMKPLLRGGDDGGVLVSHRLGRRDVSTSIHRAADGRFSVLMDLGVDAAHALTRVTVLRGEREVASEAARQGRVMLPELSSGRWRVRISDREGWVGDLDLTLSDGTDGSDGDRA